MDVKCFLMIQSWLIPIIHSDSEHQENKELAQN
jgi:hypothetical protein